MSVSKKKTKLFSNFLVCPLCSKRPEIDFFCVIITQYGPRQGAFGGQKRELSSQFPLTFRGSAGKPLKNSHVAAEQILHCL